jgi:hypothetical protein
MWEDPIVEEVHRTREKLAAEHNFDVKAIFADLRKRQVSLGGRLVPAKKKTEQTFGFDSDGRFGTPESAPSEAVGTERGQKN